MSTISRTGFAAHLLEREDALAALHGAHSESRLGTGRLAFVAGEAGIGKTSLVRAFCESVQGSTRILQGTCDPLFTPRPLGPFEDVAAAVGGDLALAVAQGSMREIADALVDELTAPSVLVLEDLHWADEATLDIVRMVGRRVELVPAVVLVTYRDDELDRTHPLRMLLGTFATAGGITRVRLEPLTRAAVTELADGYDVDVDRLYRTTGGNPFYVTQVLEAGDTEIPQTLRDATLARAARLDADASAVLDVTAITPRGAEARLLEEVCGDVGFPVDACIGAGLLVVAEDGVAFRHELARMAVEESLQPMRRRALHRRVLRSLSDAPTGQLDLARLAHHAEAAGDVAAVLRFAPAAAAEASSRGAHREAAAHYARALRFGDTLSDADRADLLEHQSRAYYYTDDQLQAIAALREAVECHGRAGATERQASALSGLVPLLACRGRLAEAEQAAMSAIEMLDGLPDSRDVGVTSGHVAHLYAYLGDGDAVSRWGTRAIELATRYDDPATLVDASITVGVDALFRDGLDACAGLERALELARQHELREQAVRAVTDLAYGAEAFDDHELAEQWLVTGLAQCDELELDLWRLALLSIRVRLELDLGRWAEATETAALIGADTRDSPDPLSRPARSRARASAARRPRDTSTAGRGRRDCQRG